MHRFLPILRLLSLFLLMATPLQAQEMSTPPAAQSADTVQTPQRYVKMRLLPEQAVIHPGEEIWVGLEQSIAEGWHTYWRNPGDSGTDTRIKWTLPEGFQMGDIQWPSPYKLPYGPMTNYGYANNVILLQKLKAPDTLPEGPLTLTAAVDVLVCHDICIPESGTYSLTLNAESGESVEDNAAYLADAQSKLPAQAPERVVLAKANDDTIEVRFPSSAWCNVGDTPCADLELFPLDWGIVNNTAKPKISFDGTNLTLRQQAGDRDWSELDNPHFVVTYTNAEGQRAGMEFVADIEMPQAAVSASAAPSSQANDTPQSLPVILVFALLGGLILNLMPCVFPVLSLKALSLVKIAEKHPREARMHGIAYTGGIILSFLAIAAVLTALKAGGLAVGWGFHLQNPVIIILLIYLLFIVGLNLMGFFEITLGSVLGNAGGRLTQSGKLAGSFFTGVLATLVATPCTAPFMGAALGFALTHSAIMAFFVFTFLGLGLALPYLVLSFIPALQRFMPKPGAWMETFRQFLAFPVFLTCAWLLWVLSHQVGATGILGAALGVTALSFAIWLWKKAPAKGLWCKVLRGLALLQR
ncbi:MAG: disulfide bond formation protein DsbD [Alphaproteobacteria bacterium]|nr:disulfide bond formation protein DsbD [Alphaproteobacteria bacterium]